MVDDVSRGVRGGRGGRGSERDRRGDGREERSEGSGSEGSERDGRERRSERRERSERNEREGRGERRERSERDGREEKRGEGSESDGREGRGEREDEGGREGERENEDVAQFKLCKTYLDICNWLVTKPEILNMTLQMSESNKCSIGAPDPIGPADPVDLVRLWDESIKCLFLRFRNPPSQILDEMIAKIFNVKVYANVAKRYLEKTRKSFTDFRNKFNQNILESVEEYKKIRTERGTHGNLSTREVREYIDDDVTEKLLSRQLGGVNLQELKKNGGFDVLVEFVRETFRVSWGGKNLDAVKALDNITKDLIIPSRSGSNVVNLF